MLHKDSQKRIYINNAIYFITTNVVEPLYIFKENLFCDLFVADLEFCRQRKQFNIFGYKVNPDHVHLLIQPFGKINYSEIMRSLKTNFSRNTNYILGYNEIPNIWKSFEGGVIDPAFKNIDPASKNIDPASKNIDPASKNIDPAFKNIDPAFKNIDPAFVEKNYDSLKNNYDLIMNIKTKYSQQYNTNHFAKFHWQSSFYDHLIRDESDYFTHLNYIRYQWKKHELKENKYCFVSKIIPDFLYTRQLKFKK